MLIPSWVIFIAVFIGFFTLRARKPSVKEEVYCNLSTPTGDAVNPSVLPIRANIFITYKNSKGEISERRVKVSSSDGSEYIYAQCLLRNEARTLRIDRILNCTNLDNGEVVDNIPLFFREKYDHA